MSTISASTTSTTAYKVTADTTGTLVLQTGASPTTAVTIGTNQVATFAQAPVLPAASIPQAALAANVAGNGPAFSASGGLTISNGVNTVITLTTEQFDTANCFNNTGSTVGGIPAYAFKPNVAGYYIVTFGVQYQGTGYAGYFVGNLNKTGSGYRESVGNGTYQYTWVYGSTVLYLDGVSDYIQLLAVQLQGTSQLVSGNFSATLVRAA